MTLRIRHELAQLEQTHACFKDGVKFSIAFQIYQISARKNLSSSVLKIY